MVRKTMAEVALKEARLDLEKCAVTAPIAGVIQDRFVEKGEYLAPGMRAFSIVDIDRVKVVLDLPERDVYAVRVGDAVPFAVDALPDRKFAGKLRFVAPAANPKSNTFRVEILVENTDHVLKPGVITRISLTRRILKGAIAAPLAALIPEKGLHVAYVVENEHAIRREVKLQAIVNDQAVVAEGLKAGDKVVIEGQRMVSDGARVSEPAGGANPNPPSEPGGSTEK
jgi:membrane fusion protein (multidrug efflux system)